MTVDDPVLDRVCAAAARSAGEVRGVVAVEVDRFAPLADDTERARLVDEAVARLDGLDRLDRHLRDPTVDEVMVTGGTDIWVDRDGRLQQEGRLDDGVADVVLQRILAPTGRRLDRTNPVIDARLPDGSRLCAAVAPVAVDGTTLSIRRHRPRLVPLDAFAPPPVVRLVRDLVDRRANVLVSGATSAGKTTLLAAAMATLPRHERLVLVEDTAELDLPDHHLVRLEARPATADGLDPVTTTDLARAALRLRPDRLLTGEFRGDEALAVVQALTTGHDGSWSTCHANSALDALDRLATLVLHAAPTWPLRSIRSQVNRSIDAVIHLARRGGTRRIDEVLEPAVGDRLEGRHLVAAGAVVGEPERRR